jgi:hypothetical protein
MIPDDVCGDRNRENLPNGDGDGNLTLGAEFHVDNSTLACQVGLLHVVECYVDKTILKSKCTSMMKPFQNPMN